ncbi:MAG TPA: transporter substrate-binding domain-containing protein, partial [Candidatus Binatia bacterium]|nr:transporter substrate-binding domain-containing protein [Candidatus Binatia bacterium]
MIVSVFTARWQLFGKNRLRIPTSLTAIKLSPLFLFLGFFSAGLSSAQTKEPTLRVATREVRPFVFEDNGQLTGFSVELWQEIARQMNVKSQFVMKSTVKDLLSSVNAHEAALGIAAISITAERELQWDFSQPMFDAGLQILVPAQSAQGSVLGAIVAGVFSTAVLPSLGIVLLIILIPAHLVWFFERRNPNGMLVHRGYFPGIFEACWWA